MNRDPKPAKLPTPNEQAAAHPEAFKPIEVKKKLPMRTWHVSGEMTISVHAEVRARTRAGAIKKAKDLPLQTFCHQCSTGAPRRVVNLGRA